MVYLPCHSQTSPICAKTYGQNTRNKSPATSPNPPSASSKKPSKVPSSIAKTNNPHPYVSTAHASTTNPSNKPSKTLQSSNHFLMNPLPSSHHLLPPFTVNMEKPILGRSVLADNFHQATSCPNERKTFEVADPSSPSWSHRFGPCSIS